MKSILLVMAFFLAPLTVLHSTEPAAPTDPLTPRHRPTPDPFPARRGEKQIPSRTEKTFPVLSQPKSAASGAPLIGAVSFPAMEKNWPPGLGVAIFR